MWLIQAVPAAVGAALAWVVAKLLEPVLDRIDRKRTAEEKEQEAAAFPWKRWCIAHAVAGGIAGAVGGWLGPAGLHPSGRVGIWLVFGAVVGLAQWIVLRRDETVGPFWAAASVLGWSVWPLFQDTEKIPGYFALSAVGLVIGTLQWTVLRRTREKTQFWAPANIVAWPIASTLGLTGSVVSMVAGVPLTVARIGGWAAVGLLGSLILGWALGRMPRREAAPAVD